LDEPGRRKIHRKPTSLAGGLTVLMAALPFCLYYFYTLPGAGGSLHWFWFGGLLAFFLLGLTDDFRELGPGVKFLVQLLLIGVLTTRIHFEFSLPRLWARHSISRSLSSGSAHPQFAQFPR
jgi:UDP-N-acetylmuramyl pentapeptide phosphotransferase/UDP-N-acetylglucosamine-1-phosphate transferase